MSTNSQFKATDPYGSELCESLQVTKTLIIKPDVVTPIAAATVNVKSSATILTPAGTLATLTINLPRSAEDGQKVCLVSTADVTAATFSGTFADTAPTALTAHSPLHLLFHNGKWYNL